MNKENQCPNCKNDGYDDYSGYCSACYDKFLDPLYRLCKTKGCNGLAFGKDEFCENCWNNKLHEAYQMEMFDEETMEMLDMKHNGLNLDW